MTDRIKTIWPSPVFDFGAKKLKHWLIHVIFWRYKRQIPILQEKRFLDVPVDRRIQENGIARNGCGLLFIYSYSGLQHNFVLAVWKFTLLTCLLTQVTAICGLHKTKCWKCSICIPVSPCDCWHWLWNVNKVPPNSTHSTVIVSPVCYFIAAKSIILDLKHIAALYSNESQYIVTYKEKSFGITQSLTF